MSGSIGDRGILFDKIPVPTIDYAMGRVRMYSLLTVMLKLTYFFVMGSHKSKCVVPR